MEHASRMGVFDGSVDTLGVIAMRMVGGAVG